jgi:hypothetical protein
MTREKKITDASIQAAKPQQSLKNHEQSESAISWRSRPMSLLALTRLPFVATFGVKMEGVRNSGQMWYNDTLKRIRVITKAGHEEGKPTRRQQSRGFDLPRLKEQSM